VWKGLLALSGMTVYVSSMAHMFYSGKQKIDSIKSPILASTLRKLKQRFLGLKSVLSAG
jgi:ribosomal protein L31